MKHLGFCDIRQYEHVGQHEQIFEHEQRLPPFPCVNWRAATPNRFTGFDDVQELPQQPLPRHPLPWTQHTFLVLDANGREVVHFGGVTPFRDGSELEQLVRFIVESANARWSR